jgi:phage major head subunit gpT-like protein
MAIPISYQAGLLESVFGKKTAPIAAMIERRVEEWEKNSQLKNLFKMTKSTHFGEVYTSMTGGEGFAPVDEGGDYPTDDFQESYYKQLESVEWKDSFEVTEKAIEDGLDGIIERKAKNFSDLWGRTRENFGASLIWGGLSTSMTFGRGSQKKTFSTTGADAQAFFSTAHPSIASKQANQSNLFANALNVDNLSYIQEKMQDFRGDDGELLDIMPDTILIPNKTALKKAAFAAVGSELDPDTANNTMNFQYGLWNIIIWPYLNLYAPSSTIGGTAWFMLDSRYVLDRADCTIFQDRAPLRVRSEIASNDNNIWKGRGRFTGGFVDWRGWAVSYATSGGTDASA